jgi:hypothetical protein
MLPTMVPSRMMLETMSCVNMHIVRILEIKLQKNVPLSCSVLVPQESTGHPVQWLVLLLISYGYMHDPGMIRHVTTSR